MKGGKKKKQPNDAPFNEIISQMKNINGKCIPCMIDFEGYSIYHCDTPLQPKKTYDNIFLAKFFIQWQKLIQMKKERNFLDLSNLNRFDTLFLSHFFYDWKTKYTQLRKANVILYFTKWQLLHEKNILRNFLVSYSGRRAFMGWKQVLHRSKTVGRYQKRQMRKYFLILKNVYQGVTSRARQFQKRSLLVTGLSTKRTYFKKWIRQYNRRKLSNKQEKMQNKEIELKQKLPFLRWKKHYLLQLLLQRKGKVILKDSFEYWKNSNNVKQKFIEQMNVIRTSIQQRTLIKMMKKWKQRYRIIRNKRRKASIKLWSLIVYRKINYAQIQQNKARSIEMRLFSIMKKQMRKTMKVIGKRLFDQWRRITFLQTSEKAISQNYMKIKCETCLIKWRMKLHKLIDERIVEQVKRSVVEKNCMMHCFKIWITKAMKIHHHKMKKVKKFRRKVLLVFPFIAWRNIGYLKTLRAEQHLRQVLLKKYFPAFKMYKKLLIDRQYEQAVVLDRIRIEKIFFYRMRNILEERGFNYNYNNEDQLVIKLLNRNTNFLCVSRLKYI